MFMFAGDDGLLCLGGYPVEEGNTVSPNCENYDGVHCVDAHCAYAFVPVRGQCPCHGVFCAVIMWLWSVI